MKKIEISVSAGKSTVYCGSGLLEEILKDLDRNRIFVITDSNVYSLYGEIINELSAKPFVIPAGEKSKNLNCLKSILGAMAKGGVNRYFTVVAIGGGVVGDIAGLAASLFMRGVRLVQVPTTLLAQVDSSVGGKTAVDFMGVKNVIGTFYQPEKVIADSRFLSTLPAREIRCGLGEIIKYGALDSDIYDKLIANKSNLTDLAFLESIVGDCIAHKAKVVAADERDTGGLRKTLNLGHTTGHAFELYYKRKSHGEFVLIGMYYELYIAVKYGVCEENYANSLYALIKKVIKNIPAYSDAGVAAKVAAYDKKNTASNKISLVVPSKKGKCEEIVLPIEEYIACIEERRDSIRVAK